MKGMGQIASLRQERSSCSATVGRLGCTQHGIGRLLLIRQAIARDAGPRAPPRDPRGLCFSGTASSCHGGPLRTSAPHSLGISLPSERGREKGKPVLAPSNTDNKPETFCLPDENECIIANPAFVVYSSIVSFYVPFIVTLLVYVQIYIVLRKRRKRVNTKRSSHGLDSDTQAPLKVTRPLCCSHGPPSFTHPHKGVQWQRFVQQGCKLHRW